MEAATIFGTLVESVTTYPKGEDRPEAEVVAKLSDLMASATNDSAPEAVASGALQIKSVAGMDRIARDAEDIAWLGKKLKFSRVRMHTVAENEIDDIKLAVASMLGSIFLSQLQQKTVRGMQAAVLAGRFPGGRAYGYRKVNRLDERGEPVRGLLEIAEDEAEIVRRIYREFAAGRSARDIAKRLNADGVVSPRGGQWNQSTVRGDPKKLVGILNNPLYVGQLVWGRREWRKNPDTERRERRYRVRDKSEWVEIAVPDLRIVDDGLATSVREQLNRRALPSGSTSAQGARRQRHLLSGLIKCGICGANYVVAAETTIVAPRSRSAARAAIRRRCGSRFSRTLRLRRCSRSS
jgi:DNA invertase Pin-like site-specific DNA recombinase